jgi:lysophospholipase L1-like esterase
VYGRRLLDWYLPAALAAGCALVLATGFVLAMRGGLGQPVAPSPRAAVARRTGGALRVVALGDSISDGVGDPVGGGYVARVCQGLRRRGRTVLCTNLAVSGAETDGVLAVARQGEARRQLAEADVILVSAGGNDLSHALRSLPGDPAAEPEAALARARANLTSLVRELRGLAPRASLRLLGLYNPFEIQPGEGPRARAQLLDWNVAIEQATQPFDDVLAVPIADAFAGRPDRLAGDRYHPGSKGHLVIAARVLATLPAADQSEE